MIKGLWSLDYPWSGVTMEPMLQILRDYPAEQKITKYSYLGIIQNSRRPQPGLNSQRSSKLWRITWNRSAIDRRSNKPGLGLKGPGPKVELVLTDCQSRSSKELQSWVNKKYLCIAGHRWGCMSVKQMDSYPYWMYSLWVCLLATEIVAIAASTRSPRLLIRARPCRGKVENL